MADNKSGRDKQAQDQDRRQRERAIRTELERGDEPEPPIDPSELATVEVALESVEFPATGADVVAAVGDHEIAARDGTYTVEELVPAVPLETFDSPTAVRERVQRPTAARAMKRVVEASATLSNTSFPSSQREGYAKTFRALENVDADDDDEGIAYVREWIVDRIEETGKLPGSRDVRREAAKFCRRNDYPVRNDEWLGV